MFCFQLRELVFFKSLNHFTVKTTTEKGGIFKLITLSFKVAPVKVFGSILSGFSNVLSSCNFGELKILPVTFLHFIPSTLMVRPSCVCALMLVMEICTTPAESFDADADKEGSVSSPNL